MPVRDVLSVFETHWDRKQIAACGEGVHSRFAVHFPPPADADCEADLDVLAFIDRQAADARVAGVLSSSDYPGAAVAAAIASRLGLPGPRPERVLESAHKWYSRIAQREVAPEAVPAFELIDPRRPHSLSLAFPCFVKPVKGSFSVLARRVSSQSELEAFLSSPVVSELGAGYLRIFDVLRESLTSLEVSGRHFIAEELLLGDLVTVEGFACDGEFSLLGIVDSILHPETRSFVRFDYPSRLPDAVQRRMIDIAARIASRLGLERTLLNIEMTWDAARDRIGVIEVNPRLCGQFADLYQKVDGVSGYEIALELCTGAHPRLARRRGRHAFASSVPLRVFEPVHVSRAPESADVAAAEALFADTLVWSECRSGDVLSDFERGEDGQSHRYAVINLGAPDPASLAQRFAAIRERLGYVFAPLKTLSPAR